MTNSIACRSICLCICLGLGLGLGWGGGTLKNLWGGSTHIHFFYTILTEKLPLLCVPFIEKNRYSFHIPVENTASPKKDGGLFILCSA